LEEVALGARQLDETAILSQPAATCEDPGGTARSRIGRRLSRHALRCSAGL